MSILEQKGITMKKKSNKYKYLKEKGALIGALFFILVILLNFPIQILIARDFESNKILNLWKVNNLDKWTISYTHSVMLSEVTETYEIQNNKIILVESTFKDYGAGLPASTPYNFTFDKETGLFTISNINEEIYPLVYRTGATRANHEILINNHSYDFLSFSNPKEAVELTCKKTNLLYFLNLKRRFCYEQRLSRF